MSANDEQFMRLALREAEAALEAGELPIGGVLVANGEVLGVGQTSVRRLGSITAHSELLMLREAGDSRLFTAAKPVALYTTLEPCLMCLGAMIQCEIDRVIYGMKCLPDGGTPFATAIHDAGQKVPEITAGVLELECVDVFARWPHGHEHAAFGYVQAILSYYDRKSIAA